MKGTLARMLCVLVLLVGVSLPPVQALAQEGSPVGGAKADLDAVLSDAEMLLRLQQAVEHDEVKLEWLRADLAQRQAFLNELTGQMERRQTAREELEARLQETSLPPEQAARLREELTALDREYDRFKRHSSLTFEAERALRRQTRSLEEKRDADRRALAIFRGTETAPAAQPAGIPERQPEEAGAAIPPGVLPVPSSALQGSAEARVVRRSASLGETAEQIAARQELERKDLAARTAAAAVEAFVKRREEQARQIQLERQVLEVDERAIENLRGFLRDRAEWSAAQESTASPEEKAASQGQRERVDAEIERVAKLVERRRDELTALEAQLGDAARDQERVSEIAAQLRSQAESARRWLVWLGSPLYPGNVGRWLVERGPRVLAVLALAGIVLLILRMSLRRIARAVVTRSRKTGSTAVNRADTLALSFQSVTTTVVMMAGALLVLQEAGFDVKTVLGGAAILGVAFAFGAQNLMRDYFTGFMMLLEDQYELGDLVTIGSITGVVERVNMRVTVLRDLEGRVHFIPNGQIASVTNRTYDWSRALVEVPLGPKEDVDQAIAVVLETGRDLKADPEWSSSVVDDPVMLGVDRFTDAGGLIIRLMLKTESDRMFPVRREMLRRIKKAFDARGIELGVPLRIDHGE